MSKTASPKNLKKGDTVAIVSTARKISKSDLKKSVEILESWGLKVVFGKNLFKEYHQYSGTEKQRVEDFQAALDNPEVKAIICARGGYGTARIIDQIQFKTFAKHPKWIVGYSDITVIHSHIAKHFGIPTIHGSMPINFPNNTKEALNTFKKALFEESYSIECKPHKLNKIGVVEGKIVGGNLSIFYSLMSSPSEGSTKGKILFLEDLDEYLYHIDRMMLNLERSGKLKGLKALIVGGMTDMKDNAVPYGKTAEEIILEHAGKYDYPICFGFPAGHISDNRAVVLNKKASLEISKSKTKLAF